MRQVGRAASPGSFRVVAAAMALATVLAGCGSAALSGGTPPGSTGRAGPPGGTRAQALVLARAMMSRLVLPPGSRLLPGRVPPALRSPGDSSGISAQAGMHRHYTLALPVRAAIRYFLRHAPRGMRSGGSTSGSGPGGVVSHRVTYSPRTLPRGIYQAELDLTIVPAGTGSLLRAGALAVWYLPRSAAEYIDPARFGAVTVTAQRTFIKPRTVTRTFTSPRVIARLARVIDGLPAVPLIPMPCPMGPTSYRAAFAISAGGRPAVVVTSAACSTLQVTAGGRDQPLLADPPGAFNAAAAHVLGRGPRPLYTPPAG